MTSKAVSFLELIFLTMKPHCSQIFANIMIHRNSYFSAINFQALLNPNVCQCITAIDEAATDFLENIIGHVKDTSRPVNQMLALKVRGRPDTAETILRILWPHIQGIAGLFNPDCNPFCWIGLWLTIQFQNWIFDLDWQSSNASSIQILRNQLFYFLSR